MRALGRRTQLQAEWLLAAETMYPAIDRIFVASGRAFAW